MCEPVSTSTIVLMAISAASAVYSTKVTNDAAEDQFQAQHDQATAQIEENLSAAEEELGQRLKESRRSRARARVAGGESGAQGQSFATAINQSIQDQNVDAGIIAKNIALGQKSTLASLDSVNAGVRTVSSIEAGLQIGTAAGSQYKPA